MRAAYLVIPALDNLTFWDKIALRYSLDVVLAGSTGSWFTLVYFSRLASTGRGCGSRHNTGLEKSIVQIGDVADGRR
jgi:hypothetical protein